MNGPIVSTWQPEIIGALADRIRAVHRVNGQTGRNTIICIAGGSSTGKSTQVAQGLREWIQPDAQLLSQDNFQLGRDFLDWSDPVYGWDALENYGLHESQVLLTNLKDNLPAKLPIYSFAEACRTGMQEVQPTSIVLFEGLYAGFGPLRGVADLLIYVEAPLVARVLRRLFRSCFERYQADPTRSLRSTATGGVLKAHRDLVRQQRPTADLILQMPYRFADTIRRFGLTEQVRSFRSQSTLFSACVDEDTELQVVADGQGGRHLCLLHRAVLYFTFPIDTETFDWLTTADLASF
ncbi:uridine kinase family protein [Spirosoma arcticum]